MKKTTKRNFELEVTHDKAEKGTSKIGICGWHANYNEFEHDDKKGTMTYINGKLVVIFDGKHTFGINLQPIVESCLATLDGSEE